MRTVAISLSHLNMTGIVKSAGCKVCRIRDLLDQHLTETLGLQGEENQMRRDSVRRAPTVLLFVR